MARRPAPRPPSSARDALRASLEQAQRLGARLRARTVGPAPKRAPALRHAVLEGAARVVRRDPRLASECALAALALEPTEPERSRAYDLAEAAAAALEDRDGAAEIWLALTVDAWGAGRAARAEAAALRAHAIAERVGSVRLRARVHIELGRLAFGRSDWSEARRHTETARAIAAEHESDLEALAHIGLAAIGSHALAPDAARHARRAILIAARIGSTEILARAQAQLGIVLVERGVHDEGRAVLESAIALERERRVDENECRALLYLAMLELDAGRPLHALRCLARAAESVERGGSQVARGMVVGSMGVVHLVRGHPRPAARDLLTADLTLEDVGNRHGRITFSAFLGAAEALAGRHTEAHAAFAQTRALMHDGGGPPYAIDLVRVLECVLALSEGGSVEAARATLADIEAGPVVSHWADLRVGCLLLRRAILGEACAKLPRNEATPGLVVAHDARWFSLEGAQAVDLEARPVLRRALGALAHARTETPGRTLSRDALAAALWPEDQRLSPRLLANRVNVSIAALRRLGLRDVIRTGDRGYRLREELPLTIDPD